MNLHMPQDPEAESELRNLAAVPHQIVSPGNNMPIIGIYQDSMLGSYRFTREHIDFTQKEAMNLLMMYNYIDPTKLKRKRNERVSNFEILSQIMPPISLKVKNKQYNSEKEKAESSNNIVEIVNGTYVRGQIDKGIFGSGTKGIIHRVCNDFGNMAAADFVDDIQNVVTEYMKQSAFSVGISDIITSDEINDKIISIISDKKAEVNTLIKQVQIGVFENNSGKTNEEEFETRVNNIMGKGQSEAGRVSLNQLDKDNRFVVMYNAGSKGSEINIQQMTACLGQQNVDGKRIPYGFDHRTLPHFTKYDDSASARGFVESSFIDGLSPQELFFHAMGGRVGLIDTAVKTSTTGYIQRRLIKGMEDLMVNYDMTVRTNKNKIVQFSFGEDSIDTVKVENQDLPVVDMSIQDIYAHYAIIQENAKTKALSSMFVKSALTRQKKQEDTFQARIQVYIDFIIENRQHIITNVFSNKPERVVRVPVAFSHIIQNILGQQNINANSLVDITLLEALEIIESTYSKMERHDYTKPSLLFKVLFFYYLSPKDLLINKRFNKKSIEILMETVMLSYKRAIVSPGDMVGMIAAQSIGEPTTQMSCIWSEKISIIKQNKTTGEKMVIVDKIGDICDEIIGAHPEYTFGTGHLDSVETILEQSESEYDYYIVGVDENEKTCWNKISHVSRHPVNGGMIRVFTKSGRSATTTLSHSHLIRRNNRVEAIDGYKLKKGMRIPVAKYIDKLDKNIDIDIDIDIDGTPYVLNELFGWFIGVYLAKGYIHKNTVCISNVDTKFNEFAKLFNKIAIISRTKQNCFVTKIKHVGLVKLLLKTCKSVSITKEVPAFAFTAPNEFNIGLIQGYTNSFNKVYVNNGITISGRSEELVKGLSLLFNYFGIFSSLKTNMVKGNPKYSLNISAKYASLYKTHIGSIVHSYKLDALVEYGATNLLDEIDNINGLGETIAKCGKTLKLPGYGIWSKREIIGRITLDKYIEEFERHENRHLIECELTILKQANDSDVVWDEIVKIEEYVPDVLENEREKWVYDFTVPFNQTFMLYNGVFVHNTLNTFHLAGLSSKSNVTRGVPRIEEILSLSASMKNPSLTVYMKPDEQTDKEKATTIQYMIEHTKLEEVVKSVEICFDPDDMNTLIEADKLTMSQYKEFENMIDDCLGGVNSDGTNNKSKWVIRMELDPEVMLEKNITMDDVHFTLNNSYKDEISCVYSDYNADKLVFRIRMNNVVKNSSNKANKKTKLNPLDQSDQIYLMKNFQDQLLTNIVLRGIKSIDKVILRKVKDNLTEKGGAYVKEDIWVLDTIGTNLMDVLALDFIDKKRTTSNDITEIFDVLGMEAARQCIFNEITDVLEFDGSYVNAHHMSLLCDRITHSHKMVSIFRHGINNDDIGPIAKASFEETPEMFLKAARHAELDTMRGISANVMCGQEGLFGTSAFQIVLDMNEMIKLDEKYSAEDLDKDTDQLIDTGLFKGLETAKDKCSTKALQIQTNVANIKSDNSKQIDDEYNPF